MTWLLPLAEGLSLKCLCVNEPNEETLMKDQSHNKIFCSVYGRAIQVAARGPLLAHQ